jgi:hypothetical protein
MGRRALLAIAAAAWFAACAIALQSMWMYTYTPGPAANAPRTWPAGIEPGPGATQLTLVLFAHPQCPCTAASLDNLAALESEHPGQLDIRVYFYSPRHASPDWLDSPSWMQAGRLARVQRRIDTDGEIARRFGARVSGQTLVFDSSRRLRFSGGITAARGHGGDNAGLRAVNSLLARPGASPQNTPVYGCFLHEHADSSQMDS